MKTEKGYLWSRDDIIGEEEIVTCSCKFIKQLSSVDTLPAKIAWQTAKNKKNKMQKQENIANKIWLMLVI